MSRFRTAGDDYLFDPRQKGSDLDNYNASKADQHGKADDDQQDDDVIFDPRQKGSNLDDYMAQNQHLMEMKHQKKKPSFKIRRIK
jgi:hypothetical protein